MFGLADISSAVCRLWDGANLDDVFTAFWDADNVGAFPVLNEQQATPSSPFPYMIFEINTGRVITRMSGAGRTKYAIQEYPFEFRIHARYTSNDTRSPKEIAAYLAGEVMAVYGGHPTIEPQEMLLDTGSVVLVQHVSDFGARTGENEYQWKLNYLAKIDVPFKV